MTNQRFFTCAVCKRARPVSMFKLWMRAKCVCSICSELQSSLIPPRYDKIQGANYVLDVLYLFEGDDK